MTDEQDKKRIAQPADRDTKPHGDQLKKQVDDAAEKPLKENERDQQNPQQ